MLHIMLNLGWSEEIWDGNMSKHIVFVHDDVTPPVVRHIGLQPVDFIHFCHVNLPSVAFNL